jgi:hypothetical protein
MDFVNLVRMMPIIVLGLLITAGVIYIIAQLFIPQGKTLSDIIPKWDNVSLNVPIKVIILAILVSLLIEFLSDN